MTRAHFISSEDKVIQVCDKYIAAPSGDNCMANVKTNQLQL